MEGGGKEQVVEEHSNGSSKEFCEKVHVVVVPFVGDKGSTEHTGGVKTTSSVRKGEQVEGNDSETNDDGGEGQVVDVLRSSFKVLHGVVAEGFAGMHDTNKVHEDEHEGDQGFKAKRLPGVDTIPCLHGTREVRGTSNNGMDEERTSDASENLENNVKQSFQDRDVAGDGSCEGDGGVEVGIWELSAQGDQDVCGSGCFASTCKEGISMQQRERERGKKGCIERCLPAANPKPREVMSIVTPLGLVNSFKAEATPTPMKT